MANILEITAQTRKRSGSADVRRLRKEGLLPGVLYGRGTENQNLKVDAKSFSKILSGSASDNILVNLLIEGSSDKQLALIQQVQHDYLKGCLLHVDFHAVNMNEEIHAQVPVEPQGDPIGVRQGGLLEVMLHTVEVRCLPKDLPSSIPVDVTDLELGKSVHIGDLPLPSGVSAVLESDVVVMICLEPRVAEETTDTAAAEAEPAAGEAEAAG